MKLRIEAFSMTTLDLDRKKVCRGKKGEEDAEAWHFASLNGKISCNKVWTYRRSFIEVHLGDEVETEGVYTLQHPR